MSGIVVFAEYTHTPQKNPYLWFEPYSNHTCKMFVYFDTIGEVVAYQHAFRTKPNAQWKLYRRRTSASCTLSAGTTNIHAENVRKHSHTNATAIPSWTQQSQPHSTNINTHTNKHPQTHNVQEQSRWAFTSNLYPTIGNECFLRKNQQQHSAAAAESNGINANKKT